MNLYKKKRNETEFLNFYNKAVALNKVPKVSRNNLNSEIYFRILFYEIIDNILMQLSSRFTNTDRLVYLQLLMFQNLKIMHVNFLHVL